MPGYLLHEGAMVLCAHGGQAIPISPSPSVFVSGQPVTTQPIPYSIIGCPFVPPTGNGPCVTAQWLAGSTRVLVDGAPVLLQTSQATCIPTGTPVGIVAVQTRVMGI